MLKQFAQGLTIDILRQINKTMLLIWQYQDSNYEATLPEIKMIIH
jgi:hypothetical protein